MKVLISGGTGFLGQSFVKSVLKSGHSVRILSRSAEKGQKIFASEVGRGAAMEIVEGDVTRPETLTAVCEGVDVIIQCAQFPGHPVENPRRGWTYWNVDAVGTENLAKAAKQATSEKRAAVRRFIYISGAGTNGKRPEPWFRAKWYAEQAIHGTGLPATVLRPSWVYGPGDHSLNRLIAQIRWSPMVPLIGGGRNPVQPIFIEDLAEIVAACVERGTSNTSDLILDVGGPKEMTFKQLLARVAKVLGKKRLFLPVPKPLVKLASWPLQFLPSPLLSPKAVDFVTMDVHIDITPLQREFPQIRLKPIEMAIKSYL